jgi:hypothetical protein
MSTISTPVAAAVGPLALVRPAAAPVDALPPSGQSIVQAIGRIVALSQQLFPGPVSLEFTFDPENPKDEYLVFDVVAHGEYKDYRDREYEWHEEVRKIVPGSLGEFRLSVTPIR